MVQKINKFLDCNQGDHDLEGYYHNLVILLKKALVGMNQEIKVAWFISDLNHPLNTCLQSL